MIKTTFWIICQSIGLKMNNYLFIWYRLFFYDRKRTQRTRHSSSIWDRLWCNFCKLPRNLAPCNYNCLSSGSQALCNIVGFVPEIVLPLTHFPVDESNKLSRISSAGCILQHVIEVIIGIISVNLRDLAVSYLIFSMPYPHTLQKIDFVSSPSCYPW